MSRYVILEHQWNGVHYDLMLEHGEALVTWRLDSLLRPGTQPAIKLADHRMDYLVYEGKVSGNRGAVRRVAEGHYSVTLVSDQCWIVELAGKYQGKITLRLEAENHWQLEWQETS